MLEKRIIPCLLLQGDRLVKTIKFKDPKYIGDPINSVRIFNSKGADEVFIIDIDASRNNKEPNFELLEQIATEAFMPLGYAGGIKTLDQIRKVFALGYEKVAIGSGTFSHPELIPQAVKLFGSQSIVGIIDIDKSFLGIKKAVNHLNASQHSAPLEMALRLQDLGVGEIILHSKYKDGTYSGYDTELVEEISNKIKIPLISLGGASSKEDLSAALRAGCDGASAGSLFVYHGPLKGILINYPTRQEIESILLKGR